MLVRPDSPRRGTRRAAAIVAALVCALIALAALPALAAAAIIEVNSIEDGGATAGCESVSTLDECTLRGAINAANAQPTFDTIEFPIAIFDGQPVTDEINPVTALPTITEPTTITGFNCSSGTYDMPCVGVTAPAGAAALTVESNLVRVDAVAFGGGKAGIEVLGESKGFSADSDWFGFKLDATSSPIGTAGIVLGPGSDEAVIGTHEFEEATRNVFGHGSVGIFVDGASETTIEGNYIGVGPEGTTAAGLATGVKIVDAEGSPVAEAKENEVGGVLTSDAKKFARCASPRTYRNLKAGRHTFVVRAAAPASKPTKFRFAVKP